MWRRASSCSLSLWWARWQFRHRRWPASSQSLVGRKAPSGAGYITFGIEPSGPREPDQRTWFIYTLKPGTTIEDWVAVTNFSLVPLRINLYARDAEESPTGAFGVQLFRQRPVQVGSWIHLPVSSVVVDPRKAIIVPFTIKVPQDASVGDNAGGIIASVTRTASGAHGTRIRVEQRVGVRVYVRIAGALHPKLVISGLVSHYAGTLSPLSRRDAHRHLHRAQPRQSRPERAVGAAPDQPVRLVPHRATKRKPARRLPRILHPGHPRHTTGSTRPSRVGTKVTIDPRFSTVSTDSGLNEASVPMGNASASTGTWAIPWPPLGLLLLLILVLAFGHLHPFPATSRRPATARGGAPRGGSARMTREEPNT